MPPATVTADVTRPVDVWLMPLEGFPMEYVRELERTFSAELGLKVSATLHGGKTPGMYGAGGQMLVERMRMDLVTPLARLQNTHAKTVCIVLVREDINGSDGGTRFLYAAHFPDRVSIVSLARLTDTFYGQNDIPEKTRTRLYKMVKKAIGTQFYGYPRSTRIESVLYSPVMGRDDLDAMGTQF